MVRVLDTLDGDYLAIAPGVNGQTRLSWGNREQSTDFSVEAANHLQTLCCTAFRDAQRFKVVV